MATYTKKYTLDLTSTGNYIYEAIDKLEDNVDQLVTNLNSAHTTTRGDLIYKGASAMGRLAVGNAGQILGSDGTDPTWTALMLNGFVQRAKFTWKDADEIYIEPAVYHHSGTTNQLAYWDTQLTFHLESAGSNSDSSDYGADGWHYIYLDDSAIVTQAAPLLDAGCFLNNTQTPSWTVAKHGWYYGSDRCIFAVYETGGSISEFWHDGGDYVNYGGWSYDISIQDVDADWVDAEAALTMPSFSTKALFTAIITYNDTPGNLVWRTKGSANDDGHLLLIVDADIAQNVGRAVPVITDASQMIQFKHVASNNTVNGYTEGWYFPAGM